MRKAVLRAPGFSARPLFPFSRALVWGGALLFTAITGCSSDEAADDDDSAAGKAGGGSGGVASAGKGGTAGGGGASGRAGASSGGSAGKAGGSGGTSGSASAGTPATGGGAGTSVAGSAGAPVAGSAGASGSAGTVGGTGGAGAGSGGDAAMAGDTGSAGESGSDGAGGSGDAGGAGGSGPGGSGIDPFGIRQLYPSASSGAEWTSEHWNGDDYEISGRTDPNDPLGISGMRGDGTLQVTGDGELVMSGSQPRIYIYPTDSGPWRDVEVTAYYQRVEDSDTAYAGLVIGVRSGEDGHSTGTECDAHTYYARIRNDGAFDFEKELEHPASSTQARVQPDDAWPPDGEVPRNTWIGFKFVIYNLATPGQVKFEAYRDMTNGEDGGDWELVNETVDDGGWFVDTTCAEHDPQNGESDLVVTEGGVTFIRNTDVTEARYRWVTVREIDAP